MIIFLLSGCLSEHRESLHVDIYGQMYEGNVEISWESILYRPETVDWFDSWDELPMENETQYLSTDPTLLSSTELRNQSYVHLFTDAKQINQNASELADIIEPIACPIEPNRHYRVDITFIIIEEEIFAMDCGVQH